MFRTMRSRGGSFGGNLLNGSAVVAGHLHPAMRGGIMRAVIHFRPCGGWERKESHQCRQKKRIPQMLIHDF